MGAACTVGADQHFLPDAAAGSERQLRQCLSGHLNVVGSGIGTGVAWPQQETQGFTCAVFTVVDERQKRMETVAPLEIRRSFLFLRMGGHEGGIEVDDRSAVAHPDAGNHNSRKNAGLLTITTVKIPKSVKNHLRKASSTYSSSVSDSPNRKSQCTTIGLHIKNPHRPTSCACSDHPWFDSYTPDPKEPDKARRNTPVWRTVTLAPRYLPKILKTGRLAPIR